MHAIEVCDCEIAAIPCGTAFEDGSSCELVAKAAFIPDARVMDSYTVQKLMLYQRLDTGVPWSFMLDVYSAMLLLLWVVLRGPGKRLQVHS